MLNTLARKIFDKGTITRIEDRAIPASAASDSLNWLTRGDKIELRRGSLSMGTEIEGSGVITGLFKAVRANGSDILFRSYGKKVEYYDRTTEDWIEVGSDILGTDGDGNTVFMDEYVTNAGNQVWLAGEEIKIYKIMMANPATAIDHYDAAKNFKGLIKVDTNSMFLWRRKKDKTGIRRSYIDTQNYTTVSAEILGAGDGSTKTFAGTLAYKAGGARRTCFGIVVTCTLIDDSAETFTDDYDGVLTGDKGGTGTINYDTGAISITASQAVKNATNVTVTYQWEDSNNNGISDFTKSATRLAGEGFELRQDEAAGPFQNLAAYNNIYYCLHEKNTWELTLASDDSDATQNIYRKKIGIPNPRAMVEDGDGIYFIDDSNQEDPYLRILSLSTGNEKVLPRSISDNMKLGDYRFDRAASYTWGEWVLFSMRHKNYTRNNRTLLYNKLWKSIDLLDYPASVFAEYDGALIAGEDISANVIELFSGTDDNDSTIPNHWIGNLDDLTIKEMKKCKKLRLQGEVGPIQQIEVYLSLDGGPFVEVLDADGNVAIDGRGTYVDKSQKVNVGSSTLGRSEIGGGSDGVVAYNYERLLSLRLGKFNKAKIKFIAIDVGYASISEYEWWDIRRKKKRVATQYRD